MLVFITCITLFSIIAAWLLKARHLKIVLGLAALNLAIAGFAYLQIIVPSDRCHTAHLFNCDSHYAPYLTISTFNIILGVVAWFLAFQRGEEVEAPYDLSNGPLVGSQLAKQKRLTREGLRKILTGTSWAIAAGIAIAVALFIYAFIILQTA